MATTFDDKKIIYTMYRVSKKHGTKQVLKDISLSYYYGAKIGVIGLNGSGKSSLCASWRARTLNSPGKPPSPRATRSASWSRNPT
jgi:ATPase subunit of ABC transporter with duplicated ATPase domains